MRRLFIAFLIFVQAAALHGQTPPAARRTFWVAENYNSLGQLSPKILKSAVPVAGLRNPFRVAVVQNNPGAIPPSKARQDAGSKLKAALAARVRSVVRADRPLVAIDDRFYQVGDEILIKAGSGAESPVAGARVLLSKINESSLSFTVTNDEEDSSAPWQVEVVVPLDKFLRQLP